MSLLRKLILIAATPLLAGSGGAACFASTTAEESGDMTDAAATIIGRSMADFVKMLDESGVKIERERFLTEVLTVFNGGEVGGYTEASAMTAINRLVNPSTGRGPAIPDADEAAEIAWVDEKKSLPGAEVLPGGIVLQTLRAGKGAFPAPGSLVRVMYTGRLSNGTVFDKTDEPFDLPLDRVIPGLAQAVMMMRAGGQYRVFIPPALGYGSEAVMDLIPANSALDFTIEF